MTSFRKFCLFAFLLMLASFTASADHPSAHNAHADRAMKARAKHCTQPKSHRARPHRREAVAYHPHRVKHTKIRRDLRQPKTVPTSAPDEDRD